VVMVNAPYPPLGLTSISFMGLASYLIFAGIYSSAVSISQDSNLRKSIRNFALKEASLLDSIGSAHMEKEIQNKVIMFTKQNREKMVEESGVYSSLTDDDVKGYLEQVVKEVSKNQNKKS
jgi:hypothetical protein